MSVYRLHCVWPRGRGLVVWADEPDLPHPAGKVNNPVGEAAESARTSTSMDGTVAAAGPHLGGDGTVAAAGPHLGGDGTVAAAGPHLGGDGVFADIAEPTKTIPSWLPDPLRRLIDPRGKGAFARTISLKEHGYASVGLPAIEFYPHAAERFLAALNELLPGQAAREGSTPNVATIVTGTDSAPGSVPTTHQVVLGPTAEFMLHMYRGIVPFVRAGHCAFDIGDLGGGETELTWTLTRGLGEIAWLESMRAAQPPLSSIYGDLDAYADHITDAVVTRAVSEGVASGRLHLGESARASIAAGGVLTLEELIAPTGPVQVESVVEPLHKWHDTMDDTATLVFILGEPEEIDGESAGEIVGGIGGIDGGVGAASAAGANTVRASVGGATVASGTSGAASGDVRDHAGANAVTIPGALTRWPLRLAYRSGTEPPQPLPHINDLSHPLYGKLQEKLAGARATYPMLRTLAQDARTHEYHLGIQELTDFLHTGAPALRRAGYSVLLPAGLAVRRAQVTVRVAPVPRSGADSQLALDQLVAFEWAASIGGVDLTPAEVDALVRESTELVRIRDQWVQADAAALRAVWNNLQRTYGVAEVEPASGESLDQQTDGTSSASGTSHKDSAFAGTGTIRELRGTIERMRSLAREVQGDAEGEPALGPGADEDDLLPLVDVRVVGEGSQSAGAGGGTETAASTEVAPALASPLMELMDPEEDAAVDTAASEAVRALLAGGGALPAPQRVAVPQGITAELREYQRRGLDWLVWMSEAGLGCVLADDMGLGKTLQTLALIVHDVESGATAGASHTDSPAAAGDACAVAPGTQLPSAPDTEVSSAPDTEVLSASAAEPPSAPAEKLPGNRTRPQLVIVPTAVVGNWQREAATFAPGLRTYVHHGSERLEGEAAEQAIYAADLVISTYGIVQRDIEMLERVQFHRVVLDEAQNVKNPGTKNATAVRRIRADHHLALTGTPVENRLDELWAVMDFCNPGLFGARGDFRNRYAIPIERYHDEGITEDLGLLVNPFILRRLKTDPSTIDDLPQKHERKLVCDLTSSQAALYQAKTRQVLEELGKSRGIQRKGMIFSLIAALKQICDHPAVYLNDDSPFTDAGTHRSGKIAAIVPVVDEALREGRKILVFTQFVRFGEMMSRYFSRRLAATVPLYHGGLSRTRRDQIVEDFQTPDGPPMLIVSLRAGGTGVNLTAASVVIHVDRWWNPAVENQATDRAYRIGQQVPVDVYKVVTRGTIEDRIDSIIEGKVALAQSVISQGETWITELSDDELAALISLHEPTVPLRTEYTDARALGGLLTSPHHGLSLMVQRETSEDDEPEGGDDDQ